MAYQLQSFPIIYLNLGGELMYIIEQRLQAQEIPSEKSAKVLNDLLSAMLKRQFLNEIFRPGRLYPQPALKDLVEDIVHSSIMRLGHESLQKLYDLMVMSVKFQILSTCEASSLLTITATHIESWSSLTADPEILLQVQHAKNLLTTHYAKLSPWAWSNIRYCLLNYLQGYKTRVTTFLTKGLQHQTGHFHIDLNRPLPEEIVIPELHGKCKPYEKIKKANENYEVILLGSNLFNENQRSRAIRMTGFESLERLIVKSNTTEQEVRTSADPITKPVLKEDLEELELKAITMVPEKDVPLIEEETLLDLFDQAAL